MTERGGAGPAEGRRGWPRRGGARLSCVRAVIYPGRLDMTFALLDLLLVLCFHIHLIYFKNSWKIW